MDAGERGCKISVLQTIQSYVACANFQAANSLSFRVLDGSSDRRAVLLLRLYYLLFIVTVHTS
ncbi:hypothetical protein, partial [uncultured Rubinisphaera sp.]|uniref:hypothetical protein n=1 Tax=uncultured Rubinisphaera sp. TaxID=1678686 RepID=UPI0030DCB90E